MFKTGTMNKEVKKNKEIILTDDKVKARVNYPLAVLKTLSLVLLVVFLISTTSVNTLSASQKDSGVTKSTNIKFKNADIREILTAMAMAMDVNIVFN